MESKAPAFGILIGLFILLVPVMTSGQGLELTEIHPTSGAHGTSYAIYGSGYVGNAGQHTITFVKQNGTKATGTIDSLSSNGEVLYGKLPSAISGLLDVIVERTNNNVTDTLHSAFATLSSGETLNEDKSVNLNEVNDGSSDWGDVDGDGDLDLVVTGYDGFNNTANIYENDGSGNFSTFGANLTGVQNGSSDWGDFDGDGDLDLLVTGYDGANNTATIYENNGSAGFSPLGAGLTGVRNSSSDWGDFDGDGDLDLVVTGYDGSNNTAIIYENNGSGNFSAIGAGLTGVQNGSSDWGDVDGDGDLDLVITGLDGSGRTARIYENDGNGNFTMLGAGLTGVRNSSSDWGDFDGDGDMDLVVTGDDGSTYTATIYENDGSGNFSPLGAGLTGVRNSSSKWGDVDGDGDLDLVVTGDNGINSTAKVYENNGSGVFSALGTELTGVFRSSSDWADVDEDGDLDLVMTGRDGSGNSTAMLYLNSIKPARAAVKPSDGSTGVALDTTVTITFDKPVDEVDLSGITITDESGASLGNVSGNLTNSTITITHDNFVHGETYTVTVPSGAVENSDGAGNDEEIWSFTSILSPPPAAELTPADGSTGIAVDSTINITFDQSVTAIDLSGITITDESGASAGNVSGSLSDSTIFITHDNFANNETYTVTVPAGAVENADGIANNEQSWSFTSIKTPPAVADIAPVDGSTGIALDSTVTITFDQSVSAANLSGITITDESGASAGNVSGSLADSTISITHDDFANNETYTVTVPAGAVENVDGVGNPEQSWNFTSIKSAPVAAELAPTNGATGIAIDSNVSITFNQSINKLDLSGITIKDESDNSIDSVSTTLTDSTITITHNDFIKGETYTVTVPSGAVDNSDGVVNPEQTWSFTSIRSAPVVTNLAPAEGSTGIAIDSTLNITFDQSINEVDLSGITITDESGNSIDSISSKIIDSTIKISHEDFANGETYTVTVPSGAVKNVDGVTNTGRTWSFTSIKSAPVAVSLAPADSSTGIVVDSTVSITFDQSVSSANLSGITITDESGTSVSNVSGSLSDSTIIITHDDFTRGETYTVIVPSDAVENTDGVGNPMQSWSFTSILSSPVAASLAPADGSAGIAVDSTLAITFDQAVTAVDLSGISLTNETGGSVSDVSANMTDNTIIIEHVNLIYGVTYTVTVPAGAVENADGVGNSRESWSFTTKIASLPDQVTTSINISFGDASSEEDYRLVALPGAINAPLTHKINGKAEVTWNANWDDGSSQDNLVEYDSSDTFTFKPGNGFWLISTEPFKNNETLPMIEADTIGKVTIPLHSGWNIISNPIHVDVSWSDVEAVNGGTLQPIWEFLGSYRQSSTFESAKNGQAYYFLNDQELNELVIPVQPENSQQTKLADYRDRHEIRLFTHMGKDTTSVSRLILSENSSDRTDVIAPPSKFEQASLRFKADDQKDRSRRANSWASIFRQYPLDGQRHKLILKASTGQPVTIDVDGWTPKISSKLVLVNHQTGKSYQLSEQAEVTVTPQNKQTEWVLLMGDRSYVKQEKKNMLPDQLNVSPNYPNPFNPKTTIEFTLPEERHVNVRIHNVKGQQVATLVDEVRQAGIHRVTFNGRNKASGVYFAVFDIDGQRFIQKLTLIK